VVDDWDVLSGEHLVASDRVIIVRIKGVGYTTGPSSPLTMTSRGTLPYLPFETLQGVVCDLGSQFSSEIAVFGSMGSDPTTAFSVLSTPETLSVMLSRGTNPLRNSTNNAPVRTSRYVIPSPTPTIYCDDTSLLSANDFVRIGGSAFRVTSVPTVVSFVAEYIYGSVPVPIPMQNYGAAAPIGAVINGIKVGGMVYPSGGIEQLPVTISTAPLSATSTADEEVIFRGMVSKVSTDTSARGSNQIKVDCQSIMGVIRNTPFRPVPMQFYFWQDQQNASETAIDILNPLQGSNLKMQSIWDTRLLGRPWNVFDPSAYQTRVPAIQIRKDKSGGVFFIDLLSERSDYWLISTTSRATGSAEGVTMAGFPYYFSEGVYTGGVRPSMTVDYGLSPLLPPGSTESLVSSGQRVSQDWVSEIAFWSTDPISAIIDLIFGTYTVDTTGAEGVRPAGMSAWLPFGWSEIDSILDYGSLYSVVSPDIADSLPAMGSDQGERGILFPYQHAQAKTVGDVLDWVLKRSGMFMVYDRGRIKFGKWAGSGVWPTVCDDAGLGEPRVTLNFDRGNAIQQVEVDFVSAIKTEDISRSKVPVTNIDRLVSGSGKTVTLGNFYAPNGANGQLANSQALATAIAMVGRFSKAAAIVEVTYRDEVYDLDVGEFITFSTAYLPNAGGTMGLVGATGFVLKAARSWKTPTTTYTLFLYNYLNAVTRLSLISATGVVGEVIDDYTIKLEANAYTVPLPETRERAPASDAEAFEQTRLRFPVGKKLYLQLLDEYGTPYLVNSQLLSVDVDNDLLVFDDNSFAGAKVGDVIVIADAAVVASVGGGGLATMWDAFQADGAGLVDGDEALSNPWMV
jgi:hypothetical protein